MMISVRIVFAVACLTLASARPDIGINPHVVGGTVSKEGAFPFVVTIRDTGTREFFCGGALVRENFVLTAAHCTDLPTSNLLVGVGSVHLDKQTLIEVEKKFRNPQNMPGTLDHDVALLKLKKPAKLSPTVQLVNFPYTKDLDNKEVTAMGWGLQGANADPSDVLLHVNQTVVPLDECMRKHNPGSVIPGNICFGGNKNKGVCFGDSGSPLLYVDDGKQYTVGIVSWGIPCAVGVPDVFVRVSHYADWLKKIMDENK